MAFPVDANRAAKAGAAAVYAAAQPTAALTALLGICTAAPGLPESRRTACAKAGGALAERGSTTLARSVGAGIAERMAQDPTAAERARANRVAVQVLVTRCGADEQAILQDAEATDAAVRARAVDAWDRSVRAKASLGEIAACELRPGR